MNINEVAQHAAGHTDLDEDVGECELVREYIRQQLHKEFPHFKETLDGESLAATTDMRRAYATRNTELLNRVVARVCFKMAVGRDPEIRRIMHISFDDPEIGRSGVAYELRELIEAANEANA